jgi:excinuclease ABC subunit B
VARALLILEVGEEHDRDEVLRKLIESQYVRNDTVLGRGRFRVKGDLVEIQPANVETAYRSRSSATTWSRSRISTR